MEKLIIFVSGVVIGGVSTYFGTKKYFEKIAKEEIESVKAAYKVEAKSDELPDISDEAAIHEKYKDVVNSYNPPANPEYERPSYLQDRSEEESPDEGYPYVPYTITPEEFSIMNGYSKVTLMYYEDDQVIVGEDEEEVNEELIGPTAIDDIGEYEEDVVYVRNDNISTDYEVLLVHASFREVAQEMYEGVDG